MGRNDNIENEKILVKVDQNNLVYIDPNSTIDRDGKVYPRGVEHEKLVMYVNLEADLIPRSTFVAGNDQNTLTSVAKGTLNFLSNNGQDFNTSWTDAYVGTDVENKIDSVDPVTKQKVSKGTGIFEINNQNYDSSAQSFGIQSINITVKGAQFVPQVTINFVDVRGKTLFEAPENSPYNAFFHLPWPIFYLTVKGFYGKAIKYRLHLVKFSTRYNDNNGNFEITTSFVGSTYAYLTDIPIKGALNAPYMYSIDALKTEETGNKTTTKKVIKLSRGYSLLKAVISEYIGKGLLPKDFPVRTLREIGHIAQRLDKTLEQQIFKSVADTNFFIALKNFNDLITNFENETKAWAKVKLSAEYIETKGIREYYLQTNRESYVVVTGDTSQGTLEYLIINYKYKIQQSELFTNKVLNDSRSKFDYINIGWSTVGGIFDYVRTLDSKVLIKIDTLIEDIQKIRNNFNQQQKLLFDEIEQIMNNIVRSKDKGLGFEPTVRNVFGIILANAEVYVRLMKDVHRRAFDVSEERKNKLAGLTKDSKFESVFPWPEVKKNSDGDKSKVIAYPGDVDLQTKLESYNKRLWPEVDFIENFIDVSTNKIDTNSEKEEGTADVMGLIYEPDIDEKKLKKISTLFNVNNTIPYLDKSNTSILYEIWERSNYITLFDSFNVDTIKKLADFEFQNIKEILKDDVDIIGILYNNVTSPKELENLLFKVSPNEKYVDKLDNLPTVEYIKDLVDFNFKIEQYIKPDSTSPTDSAYNFINDNLNNYEPENYRLDIYPFTSPTYLSYLKKNSLDLNYIKPKNLLSVDQKEGFIISPIDTKIWVKSAYTDNLFSQYFKNNLSGGTVVNAITETSILNTPYFHKQLYSDFNKTSNFGKYAGSAYLFLNSLPFKDLEDTISLPLTPDKEVPMSSLIKEIGATHYIPYYLLLKWGSLYHRYKKFILDNNDILTGFTTSNISTITTNISGSTFFNNNETGATFTAFTVNTTGITYSNNTDVGVHPFYDAIYHQVINGYNHYVVSSGDTSFSSAVNLNAIKIKPSTINGINFWTQFVDNSVYSGASDDLRYTILPCDGGNKYKRRILNSSGTEQISNKDFFTEEQFNFRCIWSDEIISNDFSGITFFNPYQYNRTLITGSTTGDNEYATSNHYRKVIDLIGTFSPELLDQFEDMFLQFSSENIEEEIPTKRFSNVRYYKFQEILKDILTVTKESGDSSLSMDDLIIKIKERQKIKLESVTKNMLEVDNLIKITLGNPKEIDPFLFSGFSNYKVGSTLNYISYDPTQLVDQYLIDLYIGEDISGYYLNFFQVNDVGITEENVLSFRPIVLIYAGWYRSNIVTNPSFTPTKFLFQEYLKNSIFELTGSKYRHSQFLQALISNFKKLAVYENNNRILIKDGYNDRQLKVELYNYFKSFNDKWISGNSMGQRSLLEEFLFLDKANRDIGDKVYLNISKLVDISNAANDKQNLYGALGQLIAGTGFDMRALPAYVNFYGSNFSNKTKITSSQKLADNLFGTFLDVDYQESTPKVVVQYITSPTSKYLDMRTSKSYKFSDDSFNVGNTANNPLIITTPEIFTSDKLSKSNKVVAFEVSIGDQNQNIFKGIQLDQTTLKNTTESFVVLENLGRSESGAGTYNVDVGLFDYYRQASYACEINCMGNAMIQPTMYFYLKNVPMFKGSYWITEVSHSISNNNMNTTFKGTRIPILQIPDTKDSFTASYRTLFDKILLSAKTKQDNERKIAETTQTITTSSGTFKTTLVKNKLTTEELVMDAGIDQYGIPYNGGGNELFIQKVSNKEITDYPFYYRAIAVEMGTSTYPISNGTVMSLINKIPSIGPIQWGDIKDDKYKIYSTKFNLSTNVKAEDITATNRQTIFVNPNNRPYKTISLPHQVSIGNLSGPVNIGPAVSGYGIGLSKELMSELGLFNGDIVYFRIV